MIAGVRRLSLTATVLLGAIVILAACSSTQSSRRRPTTTKQPTVVQQFIYKVIAAEQRNYLATYWVEGFFDHPPQVTIGKYGDRSVITAHTQQGVTADFTGPAGTVVCPFPGTQCSVARPHEPNYLGIEASLAPKYFLSTLREAVTGDPKPEVRLTSTTDRGFRESCLEVTGQNPQPTFFCITGQGIVGSYSTGIPDGLSFGLVRLSLTPPLRDFLPPPN